MGSAIDWSGVRRVLVVKLRSIGDTVLATPSLTALKRFLPGVQIDILLEDWVAPVLDGFEDVDNVISVRNTLFSRAATGRKIRNTKYDVIFNLHGGTTGTFFTAASGAAHRIGYSNYRYSFLYNHLLSSPADFWGRQKTHSVEQQLALLGFVGIPVDDGLKTHLAVTDAASKSVERRSTAETQRLGEAETRPLGSVPFALLHPTAAFATKQWATEHFARTAEFLHEKGLQTVAIAAKNEGEVLDRLEIESKVPIVTFDDLPLPEITALASKASLFVGNDSGIAHIAAALNVPSVVIFGSSNRESWRPWTDAPNEIVFEEFPCQPCPGYICREFGDPKCILSVPPESVFRAIERVLGKI